MCAPLRPRLHPCLDLFGDIAAIPLVDDIPKRREIVVHRICAVYVIINGDEPHAGVWKGHLCVEADIQVVSAEPGHIFAYYSSDDTVLDVAEHFLKPWTIEIRTRPTIIDIEPWVCKAMFCGVLVQDRFLVAYAVGLRIAAVITG